MSRHLIMHGHFYQPPRDNPWTNRHDKLDTPLSRMIESYNRQIDIQCYTANAMAPIIKRGHIDIENNYAAISFNFGPTILEWLKEHHRDTYLKIIKGDKESRLLNNGHGNALAQIYNHIIMPLANKEDKMVQIKWGVWSFQQTFERNPEGIWLSEAAIDKETIECLMDAGLKFAVAHPRAIASIEGVSHEQLLKMKIRSPYLCTIDDGREFPIFFMDPYYYDHVGGMLKNGEVFLNDIEERYSHSNEPELIVICTDGELYGHWEQYGERFLAYVLKEGCQKHDIRVTNFGAYLEEFYPSRHCVLTPSSSWSCIHGVERWKSNCGCSDKDPGTQYYRKYLRDALNQLRDDLFEIYIQETSPFFNDPLEARYDIIEIDFTSDESINLFLEKHLRHDVKPIDTGLKKGLVSLLESQKYAQLMFTSCGWFFSFPYRVETRQILQYAAKAMETLMLPSLISTVQERFLGQLEKIDVNIPITSSRSIQNGREIYIMETLVRAHKNTDRIETVVQGDLVLLKIPFDLEENRFEEFKNTFNSIDKIYEPSIMVIDLNETNQIANDALSFLLQKAIDFKNMKRKLKIYCIRKNILEMLHISHLEEFIEIISPKIL